MIITVGNTKGGVGKTTLAVQIAIARALAGRDVWLIDGDRQGTATAAIAARAEAGRQPGIACAQYADGPTLRAQVQRQREKWDDIIIDAGGRDSTALRAALGWCRSPRDPTTCGRSMTWPRWSMRPAASVTA